MSNTGASIAGRFFRQIMQTFSKKTVEAMSYEDTKQVKATHM